MSRLIESVANRTAAEAIQSEAKKPISAKSRPDIRAGYVVVFIKPPSLSDAGHVCVDSDCDAVVVASRLAFAQAAFSHRAINGTRS